MQGTAAYGFLQAYHTYVQPLSSSERDRYYAEGVSAAGLYGATSALTSEAELEMLFHATAGRLERSDIVLEFLAIMRSAPILPMLLRPAQHLLVRAAVDLTPRWVRTLLGLNGHGLHGWEAEAIRQAGASGTASFWSPTRPSRPAGGCAFRPIICMSNAAQSRSAAPVRSAGHVKKPDPLSMRPVEHPDRLGGGLQ